VPSDLALARYQAASTSRRACHNMLSQKGECSKLFYIWRIILAPLTLLSTMAFGSHFKDTAYLQYIA
jgi:hypothetical protein